MKEISLKEMQKIELDLLRYFVGICDRYKLRYYIDGGTLLGAMCYEGFIPWDDDIDIKMPRPDYEKLKSLQLELPSYIRMEFPSKRYQDYLMAKLVDDRTVLIENGAVVKKTGIYIDILPMDGHPDDEKKRARHLKKLSSLNTKFHMAKSGFASLRGAKGYIYRLIYKPWRIIKRLERIAQKYPYEKARRVGLVIEGDAEKECFSKEWIEPSVLLDFEDMKLNAPCGYRSHMVKFYGAHVADPSCYHNLPQYPSGHSHTAYWKGEDSNGL